MARFVDESEPWSIPNSSALLHNKIVYNDAGIRGIAPYLWFVIDVLFYFSLFLFYFSFI